jgi:hypothetical protein
MLELAAVVRPDRCSSCFCSLLACRDYYGDGATGNIKVINVLPTQSFEV